MKSPVVINSTCFVKSVIDLCGPIGKSSENNSYTSSVYSLAVQREGQWLLSGLESGGINLQSVRVDEGKRITKLQGHNSAVSVLSLAQDEKSVMSGSWDRTVIDWDLNTGGIIRKFEGSGGQISALETRPLSTLPVPEALGEIAATNGTLTSDSEDKPRVNGTLTNGIDDETKIEPLFGEQAVNGDAGSPTDSLFGGNDVDSLFGDNENEAGAPSGGSFIHDQDDEFSQAIADGMREQAEVPEPEKPSADVEGDVHMEDTDDNPRQMPIIKESDTEQIPEHKSPRELSINRAEVSASATPIIGLPHDSELSLKPESQVAKNENAAPEVGDLPPTSHATFLAAAFDGSLCVWDKRQDRAIAKITPRNVPPWCMNATWSPDGNFIYAGRRNGTVDEYSLHKGLRGPERSFKLPNNSGPVSALRAMPNGRHLIWYVFIDASVP